MESSTNLTFGPYNFKYPELQLHADSAFLVGSFIDDEGKEQIKVNKWNRIFDFTKNTETGELNFKLIEPSKFEIVEIN